MSAGEGGKPVHATLIAARRGGWWRGVLLRGPSGAGKSELALRAMAQGWALVADDRVRLWLSGEGRLYGATPPTLAGLVEARGLGVLVRPRLPFARLALVVETETEAPDARDRVPAPAWTLLAGVRLPTLRLAYLEAGAVARLDLALDAALRRPAVL